MNKFGWIFLIALISAAVLTGLLRRYALATRLIDIPNARSSHNSPTPRGGGLSIVIVFLLGLPVLSGWAYWLQKQCGQFLALAHGWLWWGFWMIMVTFRRDGDYWPILSGQRGGFIGWVDCRPLVFSFPGSSLGVHTIDLGWLGQILGMFYLVWLLNLYNFMDGIDGLASIEAITVCLGGALLYLSGSDYYWAMGCSCIAGNDRCRFSVLEFSARQDFYGRCG